MFHSQNCWTLIKYISVTSSDRYHKYEHSWKDCQRPMWEPLSWKTWLARFKRAGGHFKDHNSMGLRNHVSGLLLVRWHQGWYHFLLFSCQPPSSSAVALFFFCSRRSWHCKRQEICNDSFPDFSFGCKLNNCHWLSLCHVAIFSLACRQDKDIVLFLLTCGSCLDLVDLLDKDLALILSTC